MIKSLIKRLFGKSNSGKFMEIPLSNGGFARISQEDYELISRYKWHRDSSGYAATTVRNNGLAKKTRMHRLICKAPRYRHVDHINGDRLDNRRENLRRATPQQNSCNRTARKNKTGYKGVRKNKYGTYEACITSNCRPIYLGTYKTVEEAAEAYNKAAIKYHGEHASLNEIHNDDSATPTVA